MRNRFWITLAAAWLMTTDYAITGNGFALFASYCFLLSCLCTLLIERLEK